MDVKLILGRSVAGKKRSSVNTPRAQRIPLPLPGLSEVIMVVHRLLPVSILLHGDGLMSPDNPIIVNIHNLTSSGNQPPGTL